MHPQWPMNAPLKHISIVLYFWRGCSLPVLLPDCSPTQLKQIFSECLPYASHCPDCWTPGQPVKFLSVLVSVMSPIQVSGLLHLLFPPARFLPPDPFFLFTLNSNITSFCPPYLSHSFSHPSWHLNHM